MCPASGVSPRPVFAGLTLKMPPPRSEELGAEARAGWGAHEILTSWERRLIRILLDSKTELGVLGGRELRVPLLFVEGRWAGPWFLGVLELKDKGRVGVVPGGTSRSFVRPLLGSAAVSTGVGGGGQGRRVRRPLVLSQRSRASDASKAQSSAALS